MQVRYIARQPIFDTKKKVCAYELLYRSGPIVNKADFDNGNLATRNLLSDAITVFGLPKLTNSKPAFVNFTEGLILNEFALLANPKEIVIEILEDTRVSDALILKLEHLKQCGYKLALDDYVGNSDFNEILHLVDIIKVDFMLCDVDMRAQIAKRFASSSIKLIAEKVETLQDFDEALDLGYDLFQGYFFDKPVTLSQRAPAPAIVSYSRLFRELSKEEIDFTQCAKIIHADATLMYHLFRKVSTMHYYRGKSVKSITQALMYLGTDEVRRWIILILARERNVTCSDELVKEAYLRGIFIEKLMERSPTMVHRSGDGFLLGMFSLLDQIIGTKLDDVLADLPIPDDLVNTLLGFERNEFSDYLEFILVFNMDNKDLVLPDLGLSITPKEMNHIYVKCIEEADLAFMD